MNLSDFSIESDFSKSVTLPAPKSGFMMNLICHRLTFMLELIKKLIFHITCEKKKKFYAAESHRIGAF